MTLRVFRLVDEAFADTAFTGEGARRYGGRWNSPGIAVIYTAASLSLAQLELLVHIENADVLMRYWLYFPVEVDERAVLHVRDYAELPANHARWPGPSETRRIGDRWAAEEASVGLSVPSVITPGEGNLLLNPWHSDYATAVRIGHRERFVFDRRLGGE